MSLKGVVSCTCVLAVAALLGPAPALAGGGGPPASTAYPGGRWEPGPARYGSTVAATRLTLRDGTTLEANVAYPTNLRTGQRAGGRFPVILRLNPYASAPDTYYTEHGYIFLNVRPRGTGTSDGVVGYANGQDARDGVQVVDWAARRLDGSDGRIGLFGCSYPGNHALATAALVGPRSSVKAMVPACAGGEWLREVWMVGGIPTQSLGLLSTLGAAVGGQPDAVSFFAGMQANIYAGGDIAYEGPFWQDRDLLDTPAAIVRNQIPTLLWNGWDDVDERTGLELYARFQNASEGRPLDAPMRPGQPASDRYQIIVGPWGHGGGLDPGIILQWFDTFLRGEHTGIEGTRSPMHLYEKGTERYVNVSQYPAVADYTSFRLGAGGSLVAAPPLPAGSDTIGWGQPAPGRQLEYTTRPLDAGATLSGPVSATLYASSSNRNLELIATLLDVAPDGTEAQITNGAVLGSLSSLSSRRTWFDRDGTITRPYPELERDDYLTPGRTYRLDVALFPRQWGVRPGHALRLRLTTQTPPATCAAVVLGSDACGLTAPQQSTLPGGTYTIQRSFWQPSAVNLPLLRYGAFDTAAGGPTPTSTGAPEPLDWRR
jgi:predicted acyl esterase